MLVAGLVSLRNDATQTFVDCSKLEGSGFSIPGDLKAIESVSIDASTCDFILVVGKMPSLTSSFKRKSGKGILARLSLRKAFQIYRRVHSCIDWLHLACETHAQYSFWSTGIRLACGFILHT